MTVTKAMNNVKCGQRVKNEDEEEKIDGKPGHFETISIMLCKIN